jgi:nucleoside-diphosphate-sugar epimerase
MKERILVTGGAGYIGSILVPDLLSCGYSVTVLDALIYKQTTLLNCCSSKNFNFVKGDICDDALLQSLIKKSDIIIPLAAIVGAPACKINPTLTKLVNYDAHMAMVKMVASDQKVVFPCTNSGYGIGEPNAYCTEESALKPISEYGKMKVAVESAFLETGNAVTLRLATVFGMSPRMRMDLLVNDFVYKALKDGSIILFEENFRRNYIHIRDVAQAFIFAIDHYEKMKGEPYNVGLSTANLTKRQLCERIKEHWPRLYIHSAPIGEDPDKRDYLVSNEKIEALGWQPKYSLHDGISELLKGYQILRPNLFVNV